MRNVCQIDILVGARDKSRSPSDVAKRVLEDLPSVQILSVAASGPRFSIMVLLPEVAGGFHDEAELKAHFVDATTGKGIVVASVHSLREATPTEILQRALSKRPKVV